MSMTTRSPCAASTPLPELADFLQPFHIQFRRRESYTALERYLTGLLTDHPHKNCDTLAAVVPRTSEQQLQGLLTMTSVFTKKPRTSWAGTNTRGDCGQGFIAMRHCHAELQLFGVAEMAAAATAAGAAGTFPRRFFPSTGSPPPLIGRNPPAGM
jgi:hypothetical protein